MGSVRSRSLLAIPVILGSVALAQAGPTVTEVKPDALLPATAPLPLDGAKKLARFTKAVQAAKLVLPASPATSLDMKVTPVAPRHVASGAQIDSATGVSFYGPANGVPDGSYFMAAPGTPGTATYSTLAMSFPTTAGKMYVADCRFSPYPNEPVSVSVSGPVSQQGPIEDGHYLFAFVATKAKTTVNLAGVASAATKHLFHFHGCEVGKVD